jgi:hypothetical protein
VTPSEAAPLIEPGYYADGRDLDAAVAGCAPRVS